MATASGLLLAERIRGDGAKWWSLYDVCGRRWFIKPQLERHKTDNKT